MILFPMTNFFGWFWLFEKCEKSNVRASFTSQGKRRERERERERECVVVEERAEDDDAPSVDCPTSAAAARCAVASDEERSRGH